MAQFLGYSTFLERLGEEASRDRGEGVLGLAVINLEFISRVDGSYGYEVGDRILRTLALRLRDALPEGDLIGEVSRTELACLSPMLPSPTYRIAPSILSADFARLGDEVKAVIGAGADWIHFDVMDNHYVPNLTLGPMVCEALRKHSTAPIDVHLMVQPVDALAQAFCRAGADLVSFHPDASTHVDRTLQLIKAEGCQAGLVFNPATPLDVLEWVLDKVDLVLIMSVNPGFGGRASSPRR